MSNLIVSALAGTGKTFTIINGVHYLRGNIDPSIVPSPQQQAIWDRFDIGESTSAICFAAFGNAVAAKMHEDLAGAYNCHATTFHSMGFKAIKTAFGCSGDLIKLNKKKTDHLLSKLHHGKSAWNLGKELPGYPAAVRRLVSLCKYKVICNPIDEDLIELAGHYGVDLGDNSDIICDSVRKILLLAAEYVKEVDFDDMIWLPVMLNLPMPKYDLLLVDEGQDLNFCQQQIALTVGNRIIIVGDTNQAIFGFAGADVESINTMTRSLNLKGGCEDLPLTITRRCSFAVTEEARKIVPSFKAHPYNMKGSVSVGGCNPKVNDMVVCRVNAPLIKEAFSLIGKKIPAEIIGRDIKGGLISLIKMLKADTVDSLISRLDRHEDKEVSRLKKQRNCSQSAVLAVEDKCTCLRIFTRQCDNVGEVISSINELFGEKHGARVMLSSIHKAKGLEANNVYILHPELLPHPMAKSQWEQEQEKNLKYVGITRAKNNLTWVERKESVS